MSKRLVIAPQPTETSCGPTCLDAVYRFWGHEQPLEKTIEEIPEKEDGGTYSVIIANHALRMGFAATIYTYNLRVFDPTWHELGAAELRQKLEQRLEHTRSKRGQVNLNAYLQFINLGGQLRFDELSSPLLNTLLQESHPIIAGLSATHLYRNSRVRSNGSYDDIRGETEGHFVVLTGFDSSKQTVSVSDPYLQNPMSPGLNYTVDAQRLINSVMLGIVTYDANLLLIQPRSE